MDFRILPWVCPMELRNLVFSLEYLVSNGGQVLLGGIRLGGFATVVADLGSPVRRALLSLPHPFLPPFSFFFIFI